LISITDRGVGMSAQEMAHANWRLENPPASDIEVPKWIGLLVVARLAARHGVRVRLQQAEFGGLAALIWIPDQLLIARQDATALPQFTRPGPGGLRRGAHEMAVDPRGIAAQPGLPAAQAAELTALREEARSTSPDWRPMAGESPQPVPAPLSVGSPPVPQADPAGARPRSSETGLLAATAVVPASLQQEAATADSSVIVPPTGNEAEERRLPIFEAVESKWFGGGGQAPGPARPAVTAGSHWSSPADKGWHAAKTVESPAAGSATEAGLPRRLPNANLVPGTIPGPLPAVAPSRSAAEARDRLTGFQRGLTEGRAAATEGRAAAREAAKPARDGES
jgi:hypothetical protein